MAILKSLYRAVLGVVRSIGKVLGLGKRGQFDSSRYWDARYRGGGNSGPGSYRHLAEFKAEILNNFVADNAIHDVIEFGCGDGNQLGYAQYSKYVGLDVSGAAIERCRAIYGADSSKQFMEIKYYTGETAQLALSLDVIFHLVEDAVFERYMAALFSAAEEFVIIYSSDKEDSEYVEGGHVRHRNFTQWVEMNQPEWRLLRTIKNRYPYKGSVKHGSFSDFYIYKKLTG